MNKDKFILELIEWVFSIFGRDAIEVIDHWGADLSAIGFRKRGDDLRLVYVSTYDKIENLYDFECEERNRGDIVSVNKGEDVTKEALEDVIRLFLINLD